LSRYKSPTVTAAVSRSRSALSNVLPTYFGRMREEGNGAGINCDHKPGHASRRSARFAKIKLS